MVPQGLLVQGLALSCLTPFTVGHWSPGLCLPPPAPKACPEPRLNSWLLPTRRGGLAQREDNTLRPRGCQGKREGKPGKRARAELGLRAESGSGSAESGD